MFTYLTFYKVGISESGNHDNRNYEDEGALYRAGRERSDGTTNYTKQANQINAGNLKGKLILAHGGMDDNVPPYNTYLVVDARKRPTKTRPGGIPQRKKAWLRPGWIIHDTPPLGLFW